MCRYQAQGPCLCTEARGRPSRAMHDQNLCNLTGNLKSVNAVNISAPLAPPRPLPSPQLAASWNSWFRVTMGAVAVLGRAVQRATGASCVSTSQPQESRVAGPRRAYVSDKGFLLLGAAATGMVSSGCLRRIGRRFRRMAQMVQILLRLGLSSACVNYFPVQTEPDIG